MASLDSASPVPSVSLTLVNVPSPFLPSDNGEKSSRVHFQARDDELLHELVAVEHANTRQQEQSGTEEESYHIFESYATLLVVIIPNGDLTAPLRHIIAALIKEKLILHRISQIVAAYLVCRLIDRRWARQA